MTKLLLYLMEVIIPKIKCPNRIASHILNRPYMKRIDEESLLDLQNQQDITQKEKLKANLIQLMSHETGMPHVVFKAKVEPSKTQFFDLTKDEADGVEEFRSAIGSHLSDMDRQQAEKRNQFVQAIAET